jgi:predicted hotdog family 3-hydroxylacyl-ACP dehydratase
MVLIDDIESIDLESSSLVASFTAKGQWCGNWFSIEYMAQTAAALAGAFDKASDDGAQGRPGFLLGTRRLELGIAEFVSGVHYFVKAVREYVDGDSAAFACEIWEAGGESKSAKCTATLTAYRGSL